MRNIGRRWGNSAAIRIAAPVMTTARLTPDQQADIREDDGRTVIEPARDEAALLAELIDGMTDANRHDAIEPGPPRRREAW